MYEEAPGFRLGPRAHSAPVHARDTRYIYHVLLLTVYQYTMRCVLYPADYGDLKIDVDLSRAGGGPGDGGAAACTCPPMGPNAVQLSIFNNRFMGIAEQMGRTLQRTSVSTNIKVGFRV